MLIGRICLLGWLSSYIAGFFMESISHRKYVAFLEKKLLQTSRFLVFVKYSLRKFRKTVLNSTIRNK